MFVEKTIAELEAMTAEQLQAYKTAEKAHNEAQTKSIIDAEVKAQVEAVKVSLTAEIENQITDKMAVDQKEKVKTLAEEISENKETIKAIASGDKNAEVEIKALSNRASIANNTESVRLTDIGQLGVKRRALYDFFPKVQVGNGNHNGTIAYIDWDEDTTVRAAAIVAEGATFPESTAKFAEYTKKLQKIGDTLPVTEDFMEDEVLASSELSKFVSINVNTIIDTKIAVGAGGANDIEGLYTASPSYTPVASNIPDANIKDLVRKMRTAIVKTRGSKYAPNFVAANSDTIDRYFLKKDGENNYMFDSETGTIAGLAIVEDNNLADNTLVVGDGRYGTIYEKGGVMLSEGYSGTQFVGDMKTIKARVRLLFLIRNVDKTGFLKCTNITTALATLAT
jgi:hypothetical protein